MAKTRRRTDGDMVGMGYALTLFIKAIAGILLIMCSIAYMQNELQGYCFIGIGFIFILMSISEMDVLSYFESRGLFK